MRTNESTTDRVFRIILGLVLLSLVAFGPQTQWGYIGIAPLLLGVIGFCPIYRLFRIDNSHKREICD
jgi:hypothetical protein